MLHHHLLLHLLASFLLIHSASSACSMTDESCEFSLEVKHMLTMMDHKKAVYGHQGKLYQYDVTDPANAQPVNPDNVIIADGFEAQRIVATINGQMPGPPIEVYEGQKVIVHVTNKMTSASLTIHWHGLHQKGTPWMDGVAFITQCPIQPYGTFTYEFAAYPKGTFWYHSHIGTQLSQGVVGAFIIREKIPPPMGEHILMLMDWNHVIDADLMHMRMEYGNYENRIKLSSTGSLDGAHFSMFPFHAGLINGRGRYYFPNGTNTEVPLTVFNVEQGKPYRFRIIGSGSLYPFRVSIDDHPFKVFQSDGFDLDPIEVESLIINPGERYDVEIMANQTVANYMVRAKTLEIKVNNHVAEAILRYAGAPDAEPTSTKKQCTANDKCLVLNCPYTYYPADEHTDCINFGHIKAAPGTPSTPGSPTNGPDDEVHEMFLNFAFPGVNVYPGSVNGVAFRKPPVAALTQPLEIPKLCDPADCPDETHCYCSGSITLQRNKVYQMIFLNMGNGKGWGHPIHMHGHSFHVVKMGYPTYNSTTGQIVADNLEVNCGGNPDRAKSWCTRASWANSSWGGNNVPGLELESAPMKDTIIVPTGGYAVVRIRADNPGVWFMHCHIELHNIDGMAIMINESYEEHPRPPKGWQICGNFNEGVVHRPSWMRQDDDEDDGDFSKTEFWTVVGILLGVIFLFLIITIVLLVKVCRQSPKGDRASSPGANAYGVSNNAFSNK